ncbi:MAG TPA: tetratricopeptide repeat protein [Gemmataceae bacterium]|jgi:tetratricopeptide (TPR) repeat protein
MRWPLSEYVLKGVFLGLLLCAALSAPDAAAAGRVGLWLGGGLAAGLVVAAVRKNAQGFRPAGRPLTFLLFLLLESPGLVYAGSVLGLAAGAFTVSPDENRQLLAATVGGGAVLGVGLAMLRTVRQPNVRLGVALAAAVAIVAAAIGALAYYPDLLSEDRQRTLGIFLLLGLPFFYLLTFVGEAEESEVEVAAWCAALAVAVWLVKLTPTYPALGLLVPLVMYFVYTRQVLPGLRVFKHTLRGLSYARLGRYRPALTALRRAAQLDPNNRLAREALWEVHRDLDAARIAADPELANLIDPYLCLDRVAALLLADRPTEAQRTESMHLLDLVAGQAPALLPQVTYWRAVADTHANRLDRAAEGLTRLLDSAAWPAGDPSRKSVLLPAWQLALTLHPELNHRVGAVEVTKPGRRLEAIAAVERTLADVPEDAEAWKLKRLLYHDVTEAEYDAGPVTEFDHAYAQQLGLALVADPGRWRRGVEYLRIAARGLPQNAPSIYTQAAAAYERAGEADGARAALEAGKRAGLAVGPKTLPDDERHAYFALVRRLAEDAHARGDYRAAAEDYQLYTLYERAGLETYRTLAEMYEQLGDALAAVRVNEQALLYNAKDRDLLARRDRYYYSVMPDQVHAAPDQLKQAIDVRYCLTKARQVLDHRDSDFESVDWAQHLIELALAVRPDGIAAKVLLARAKLRRGERDEAVSILESVHSPKPEKFDTDEDQEAWYFACRLLGDLYLRELDRPDLAVACYTDFRPSAKSGADTLYKLGEAYERLGEAKRAAKFYEQVTAYDGHPLAPDARAALMRVKA